MQDNRSSSAASAGMMALLPGLLLSLCLSACNGSSSQSFYDNPDPILPPSARPPGVTAAKTLGDASVPFVLPEKLPDTPSENEAATAADGTPTVVTVTTAPIIPSDGTPEWPAIPLGGGGPMPARPRQKPTPPKPAKTTPPKPVKKTASRPLQKPMEDVVLDGTTHQTLNRPSDPTIKTPAANPAIKPVRLPRRVRFTPNPPSQHNPATTPAPQQPAGPKPPSLPSPPKPPLSTDLPPPPRPE